MKETFDFSNNTLCQKCNFLKQKGYGLTPYSSIFINPFFLTVLVQLWQVAVGMENINQSEAHLQGSCIRHRILGLRMDGGREDCYIKKKIKQQKMILKIVNRFQISCELKKPFCCCFLAQK